MRRYVIGDIHVRVKELRQVLRRSNFDHEKDLLILLGDLIDRGWDSKSVVDELLKIKNVVFVMGNHDQSFMEGCSISRQAWPETFISYGVERFEDIPASHQGFFEDSKLYYELDNMLFVHGSVDPVRGVNIHPSEIVMGRAIVDKDEPVLGYKKVFVGHTPTILFDKNYPMKKHNVIMMDCGAGFKGGRLAMMDIDTEAIWLSDEVL